MNLLLQRHTIDGGKTLIGTLSQFDSGQFICFTLERPWLDNQKDVSCIPSGAYLCSRYTSPHHGSTFIINGVEGRDSILFHKGNFVTDSKGCVLVGIGVELVEEEQLILNSSALAFKRFMERLKDVNSFALVVRDIGE